MVRVKKPRLTPLQEALDGLPSKLYVLPHQIQQLADQQDRGEAVYGSCVLPVDRLQPDRAEEKVRSTFSQRQGQTSNTSQLLPDSLAAAQLSIPAAPLAPFVLNTPQASIPNLSTARVGTLAADEPPSQSRSDKPAGNSGSDRPYVVFTVEEDELILQQVLKEEDFKSINWARIYSTLGQAVSRHTVSSLRKHWHRVMRHRPEVLRLVGAKAPPPRRSASMDLDSEEERPGPAAARRGGAAGGSEGEAEPARRHGGPTDHLTDAAETLDIGIIHRAYYDQYVKTQTPVENKWAAQGEWEDTCLMCKDGGDLVCCEYGHMPGDSKKKTPCYKAYHKECLGMEDEPPDGWVCPRHTCVRCPPPRSTTKPPTLETSEALYSCITCPNSYCEEHLRREEGVAEARGPEGRAKVRVWSPACRCLCPSCQRGAQITAWEACPHLATLDKFRLPAEASIRDSWLRGEGKSKLPPWVLEAELVRSMPTNSGKPIRTVVLTAIELAGKEGNTLVQGMLGRALSADVYRNNSAGTTRNFTLQTLHHFVPKECLTSGITIAKSK